VECYLDEEVALAIDLSPLAVRVTASLKCERQSEVAVYAVPC